MRITKFSISQLFIAHHNVTIMDPVGRVIGAYTIVGAMKLLWSKKTALFFLISH